MTPRSDMLLAATLVALGCGDPPPPATGATPEVTVAPPSARKMRDDGEAAEAEDRAPKVPEAVSSFHRKAFTAAVDPKLGRPLWVVTLHGAAYKEAPGAADAHHCLVLFESGLIGTWRQRVGAPRDQFFAAEMTASELEQTRDRIGAIAERLGSKSSNPPAEGTVMGVSAATDEGVVTRYFSADATPPGVGRLVAALKHRLEATNGPR